MMKNGSNHYALKSKQATRLIKFECSYYAVRVGFEPTVPVRAHLHSKQAPSSTQPPHLVFILVVGEQSARLSSDVWRQAYVLKAWSR